MKLQDFYTKYPTNEDCIKYLENVFWNDKQFCPYCNSNNYTILKNTKRYHCNNCNTSYSILVNTIFKSTKIELQKWFLAILIIKNKNVSSRKLANILSVTKDTAWRMQSKISKSLFENPDFINKINI